MGGGSEAALSQAAKERAARAVDRARASSALRIQRCWRGARGRAVARTQLLADWKARFAGAEEADLASLLSPLYFAAGGRRLTPASVAALGVPVLARALALALRSLPASLAAPEPTHRHLILARLATPLLTAPLPEEGGKGVLPALATRVVSSLLSAPQPALASAVLREALPALTPALRQGELALAPALLKASLCDGAESCLPPLAASLLASPSLLARSPPQLLDQLCEPSTLQRLLVALPPPADPPSARAALSAASALFVRCAQLHHSGGASLAHAFLDAACRVTASHRAASLSDGGALPPMLLPSLLASGCGMEKLSAFYWSLLQPVSVSTSESQNGTALAVLSSLAFSPAAPLLPRLWAHQAPSLHSPGGGILALKPALLPALGLFCLTFSHLLLILEDDELHSPDYAWTKACASALNSLVVSTILSPPPSTSPTETAKRCVAAATALLRALAGRDARRPLLPPSQWLLPAKGAAVDIPSAARALAAAAAGAAPSAGAAGGGCAQLLVHAPHALPFSSRLAVLHHLCAIDRELRGMGPQPGGAPRGENRQFGQPDLLLRIRRGWVLEDFLSGVRGREERLRGRLAVVFVNAQGAEEAGIDLGGVFRELLVETAAALSDPRRAVFQQAAGEASGGLHPSPAAAGSDEGRALLYLAGLVLGKAIYEHITLPQLPLAPFFVEALLKRRPMGLDDLAGLDAQLHSSLLQVKRYTGDVSDLGLFFEASCDDGSGGRLEAELVEGGGDVAVTGDNRLAYVAATAHWRLTTSLSGGNAAFAAGLGCLVPLPWLRIFSPGELNEVLCGAGGAEGDWTAAQLRAHCQLAEGGYVSVESRTLRLFWRVVDEMSASERSRLLKFVTSLPRLPLGGFEALNPPFTIAKIGVPVGWWEGLVGGDVGRLPSASTCFARLNLPNYRSARAMRAKLVQAMDGAAGFDLS